MLPPSPPVMTLRLAVIGVPPFADALLARCRAAGYASILLHPDDVVAGSPEFARILGRDVILDCHHGTDKRDALGHLASVLSENTLLLTSALPASVTLAAARARHPQRIVGFSVIPPLQDGDLVEVARGLHTSERAFDQAVAFWRSLGLEPVEVGDGPGLVRGRVLACLVNEAIGALAEGVASARDIDAAMKLGANYPRGPLAWGEYLGVDVIYAIMQGLYEEWREDRYRPHPLLRRLALARRSPFDLEASARSAAPTALFAQQAP